MSFFPRALLLAAPLGLFLSLPACSGDDDDSPAPGGAAGERGATGGTQSDDGTGGSNGDTGGAFSASGGETSIGGGGLGGAGTGGSNTVECTQEGSCIAEEATCAAHFLTSCITDAHGCLVETTSNCRDSELVCNPGAAPAACMANGSGDSCDDALVVFDFPAQFIGDDFKSDFPTDSMSLGTGTGCDTPSSSDYHEAIFQVDLGAHDTLFVVETGSSDMALSLVAGDLCDEGSACLSSNRKEYEEQSYYAEAAQSVYVVLESPSGASYAYNYDLQIDVIPSVCGDGFLSNNEACDDGNTEPDDGCNADCSALDPDYVCQGTFCYKATEGDVCPDVAGGPAIEIGAGSYEINTSALNNDYSLYTGDCTGSSNGNGPDMVFAVDVPASGTITATKDLESTDFDGILILSTNCFSIPGSCVMHSDQPRYSFTPEEVTWTNDSLDTQTIYLTVDGASDMSAGVYEFSVDISEPTCGDGVIEGGETCDDGEAEAGDGCDANCRQESGSVCTGEPSVCGNGVEYLSAPALAIPDALYDGDAAALAGVTDIISVSESCNIAGIEVAMEITHFYPADLTLILTSPEESVGAGGAGNPGDRQVVLHQKTSSDSLIGSYPTTLTPVNSLDTLIGAPIQGDWTLLVTDTFESDAGSLDSWGLTIICE